MIRIVFLFLFSATVFIATPTSAASMAKASGAPDVEVVSADFGLFNLEDAKRPAFFSTKLVPNVPNQVYGWVVRLRTKKSHVKWKEEFKLPLKPKSWGSMEGEGSRTISSDGRVSATERVVPVGRGIIANAWTVLPGDPKGQYVIRLFIEGELVKVFEFEVQ